MSAGMVAPPVRAPSYSEEATAAAVWLERMRRPPGESVANPVDPFAAFSSACSAERQDKLLEELWPQLNSSQRRALGDAQIARRAQSKAFKTAQRLALDPSEELAQHGLNLVRKLSLLDFSLEQRADFERWCVENTDRALDQILAETAPALVARLVRAQEFNAECERFSDLSVTVTAGSRSYFDSMEALRDAGGQDLVERWAADQDPRAKVAALNWATGMWLDEVSVRKMVIPMVTDEAPRDPRFLPELCTAMAERGGEWGAELLQRELERAVDAEPRRQADIEALLRALHYGYRDDIVPHALALMFQTDSPEITLLVSEILLADLADVAPDPRHDLEWWKNWWQIYGDSYPNARRDPQTGLPALR
jgi:hypothetical protein